VAEDIQPIRKLTFDELSSAPIPEHIHTLTHPDKAHTLSRRHKAPHISDDTGASSRTARAHRASREIRKLRSKHQQQQQAKKDALKRRKAYGRHLSRPKLAPKSSHLVAETSAQTREVIPDAFFGEPAEQLKQLFGALIAFHSFTAVSKAFVLLNVQALECFNEPAIGIVRHTGSTQSNEEKPYDVAIWFMSSRKCFRGAFAFSQIQNCTHELIQHAIRSRQEADFSGASCSDRTNAASFAKAKAKAISVSARCMSGIVSAAGSESEWKARAICSNPFFDDAEHLCWGVHKAASALRIPESSTSWLHCRLRPLITTKSLRVECILQLSDRNTVRMPESAPVMISAGLRQAKAVRVVQRKHELQFEASRGSARSLHAQGLTMDGVMGRIPKWQPKFAVEHIDLISLQHTSKEVSLPGLAVTRSASIRQALCAWFFSQPGDVYIPASKLDIVTSAFHLALPEPIEAFHALEPSRAQGEAALSPGASSMTNSPVWAATSPMSATSVPFSASSIQRHHQSLPPSMQAIPLQSLKDSWVLTDKKRDNAALDGLSLHTDAHSIQQTESFGESGLEIWVPLMQLPSVPNSLLAAVKPPSSVQANSVSEECASAALQQFLDMQQERGLHADAHMRQEQDQAEAARSVQRLVRGHLGRQTTNLMKAQRARAKKLAEQEQRAATRIQAVQRGRRCRDHLRALHKTHADAIEQIARTAAATSVQRVHRGFMVRRQHSTIRPPSKLLISSMGAGPYDLATVPSSVEELPSEPPGAVDSSHPEQAATADEPYPADWNLPSSTYSSALEEHAHGFDDGDAVEASADELSIIHEADSEFAESLSRAESRVSSQQCGSSTGIDLSSALLHQGQASTGLPDLSPNSSVWSAKHSPQASPLPSAVEEAAHLDAKTSSTTSSASERSYESDWSELQLEKSRAQVQLPGEN